MIAPAGIGARVVATAGAFGGPALPSNARNFRQVARRSVAHQPSLSAGYDKATATAMANALRCGRATSSSTPGRQQHGSSGRPTRPEQQSQFNAGAQNSMAVQSARTNSAMLNDEHDPADAGDPAALAGRTDAAGAQQSIDVPWTMLQRAHRHHAQPQQYRRHQDDGKDIWSGAAAQLGLGLLGCSVRRRHEERRGKAGAGPKTSLPLYSLLTTSPTRPRRLSVNRPDGAGHREEISGMVRTVGGKEGGGMNGFPDLFASTEQSYGLPTGFLGRVAQIESSMNPRAQNPRSSAGGLFQFIDSTARQYGLRISSTRRRRLMLQRAWRETTPIACAMRLGATVLLANSISLTSRAAATQPGC